MENLKKTIEEYFDGVDFTINSVDDGVGFLVCNVTYTDFLPLRQVREDLEKLIPLAEFRLVRRFSPSAIQREVLKAYSEGIAVPTFDAEGNPVTVHFVEMIESLLYDHTIE